MKSSGQFTSVHRAPQFPRRFASRGILFLIAALFALGVVSSAAPGLALAQGPPEWAQDENSSGLSPYVNGSEDGTPVMVTGVLTVLHGDDFTKKQGKFFYHLKDNKTNQTFNLHFAGTPPAHLRTGATLTVRGKAKGRDLFLALDESGGKSVETVLPAIAVVAGEQKTIVMVVNFLDASVSCSVDSIQDLMFSDPDDNSVDDFYQETSLGYVSLTGDVVGPYTIDFSSTGTCAPTTWAAAAEAVAQADGVDMSRYYRKVYVLPTGNPCMGDGLGTVGGNPSLAWIFKCERIAVYGHELGHNLGMHHAATPSSEYGDYSDVMGLRFHQVNAPHKEQMGWILSDQVVTLAESGIYDIAPLELDASQAMAPQILKIVKPDTDEYYYLSYRRPLGFDANLSSTYRDCLNLHRYRGSGTVQTYFLDSLLDGESYVDSINGVTVTQLSHMDDYATVEVQFSSRNTTCDPASPMVNLSPASQSGNPGATLGYTVSVTNTDSSPCGLSTFALDPSLLVGWTGTVSPNTLALGPGENGIAALLVTAPADSDEGTYGVGVSVSDAAETAHMGSANASYVVQASPVDDAQPPTPPTGLSASVKGKKVELFWGAAIDNMGVSGYAVWRNDTRIGVVNGTSYVDYAIASGNTYTYWVEAYDDAGNTSGASNQVTLTVKNASVKDNNDILPKGPSKKK